MATTNDRLYPKPDPVAITPETVEDAFNILRQALDMVDNDVVALLSSVSGKAAAAHGHAIADISGLAAAIAAKMDASATFDLDWLNNVYSTAGASDGYVLVKTPTGWTAASAASVIGAHSHAMGDIVGLSAALLTKADATALAAEAALARDAGNLDTGTLDDARLSFTVSAFAKTLLDDADATAFRTTLSISQSDLDSRYAQLGSGNVFTAGQQINGNVTTQLDNSGVVFKDTSGTQRGILYATASGALVWFGADGNAANASYMLHDTDGIFRIAGGGVQLGDVLTSGTGPLKPKTASGGGQWVGISTPANTAFTLPAGGTWSYFFFAVSSSTGATFASAATGVAAGGTTIAGASAGVIYLGFAWRISA